MCLLGVVFLGAVCLLGVVFLGVVCLLGVVFIVVLLGVVFLVVLFLVRFVYTLAPVLPCLWQGATRAQPAAATPRAHQGLPAADVRARVSSRQSG